MGFGNTPGRSLRLRRLLRLTVNCGIFQRDLKHLVNLEILPTISAEPSELRSCPTNPTTDTDVLITPQTSETDSELWNPVGTFETASKVQTHQLGHGANLRVPQGGPQNLEQFGNVE
jgi:hypothetical protein